MSLRFAGLDPLDEVRDPYPESVSESLRFIFCPGKYICVILGHSI